MDIRAVTEIEQPDQLRQLLRAYLTDEVTQLREVSGPELSVDDLLSDTFDHIDAYVPPEGALHLASDDNGQLTGCVFLKRLRPEACEIKRLYVRPEARGHQLGRRLMDGILAEARALGARQVLLDTGVYNIAAQALYRALGFREIGPYPGGEDDPAVIPHLLFMQLDL